MIVTMLLLISLIVYTFVGYPVLLFILKNNKSIKRKHVEYVGKDITVLLVACNEATVIAKKIDNIFSMDYPKDNIKLVIVDDASDDETVKIVESYSDSRLVLIKNVARSGKACGLNVGMKEINTELVMLVDARQEITLNSMKDLASWFYPNSGVAAVSGELRLKSEGAESLSGMDAYQKYEKFIRKTESSISSVPGVSGALYMLRKALFVPLPDDTILDDVLIPMQAATNGNWIGYDDRAIAWDVSSDDIKREKLRKTRTLKGNYQLLFRNISWCLPTGHPLWFQYVSHKVSRLTAPFFAIAAFIISVYLYMQGDDWAGILTFGFILVVALYPISLGMPILNRSKLIRIGSSFVALNWFNLLGFFQYFFSKKNKSWK
jgi:biofilm PGA synthesis N-glycosyltransferase PgaC